MALDDHTIRVERALLGSLMLDPATMPSVDLTPASFASPHHRALYSLMLRMAADGEHIDPTTLPLRCEQEGPDRYGGLEYVVETVDAAAGTAAVPHLALTVDRLATLRSLAEVCTDALSMVRGELGQAPTSGTATPDEVIAMLDGRLSALRARGGSTDEVVWMADAIDKVGDDIEARCRGEATDIWPTGLPVDGLIGGLAPGRMYVVGGGTGSGKSTFAGRMAANVSKMVGVLLISLEMGVLEIAQREVSGSASVPLSILTSSAPTEREWDAIVGLRADHYERQLRGAGLCVYDGETPSLGRIEAIIRRHVERHAVRVVVVDYIQLVDVEDRRQPRHVAVGAVSRKLKALARSLDIAVVALAQVNRGVDTRSTGKGWDADDPSELGSLHKGDLRESGSIEQDADAVLMVWRPVQYDDEAPPEMAWCRVAKQRNGPEGLVQLRFAGPYVRFE